MSSEQAGPSAAIGSQVFTGQTVTPERVVYIESAARANRGGGGWSHAALIAAAFLGAAVGGFGAVRFAERGRHLPPGMPPGGPMGMVAPAAPQVVGAQTRPQVATLPARPTDEAGPPPRPEFRDRRGEGPPAGPEDRRPPRRGHAGPPESGGATGRNGPPALRGQNGGGPPPR